MSLGLPDSLVPGTDPDPDLCHQAKIERKTSISTVLRLSFMKNDNVYSKSNKQKT
jgi:hypothetical protein